METINETINEIIDDTTPADNADMFWNDAWYDHHADKILGIPYETSGRYGTVIAYKGTIDDIEKINVSLNFPTDFGASDGVMESQIHDHNLSADILQPGNEQFVQNAVSKARARVKKKRPAAETIEGDAEVRTFEEVYAAYNEGIEEDDLKVFLWYKTQIKHPLSKRWARLVDNTLDDTDLREPYPFYVDDAIITDWYNRGLVFFDGYRFIPAFIYLSGDIYERRAELTRLKNVIIERFGIEAYEKQEQAMDVAFKKKLSNRLTLVDSEDEGITILPISDFAKDFKVSGLQMIADGEPFVIKKVTAETNARYGEPDLLNDSKATDRNREAFTSLSLFFAFGYWLVKTLPPVKDPAVTVFDVIRYYLYGMNLRGTLNKQLATQEAIEKEKAILAKVKSTAKKEGDRLFRFFLSDQLLPEDRVKVEYQWNRTYDNYIPVDFSKVPVAFTMCKNYKGKPEKLKREKREAVAFVMNEGVGCLAYDVGVGKTPSAVFIMSAFLDAGYCKRPFLVVPNQVYRQFITEIKNFAPHIPILEAYNFSEEYAEEFLDAKGNVTPVPEGTITVMTYEGLEHIGFNEHTAGNMMQQLYTILNQGEPDLSNKNAEKQQESFMNRLKTLVGRGLKGGMYNIEDFGFDFACYDEAHAMKKVFTSVKIQKREDEEKKPNNPYMLNSGSPSTRALKGFMLNQYILSKNKDRNVLLLTATPFTNTPLEIFSMLSMIAYKTLQQMSLGNLKQFFDTFADVSTELTITSRLKPKFQQVILGFNNLSALQSIIFRFINYKTGEDVGVPRPNKYVLPYNKKVENGITINLDESERVETYISMTPDQKAMMEEIISYVETDSPLGTVKAPAGSAEDFITDEDEASMSDDGEEIDEELLSGGEKDAIRVLKGLNYTRALALSPYLYEYSNLGEPTYKSYIELSPKLMYVMDCIRSVRDYHIAHDEPISGQVIYMNRGVAYFDLIKEYLVKEVGYKDHEVGIIKSGLPASGKRSKEYIKNLFNGEEYNPTSMLFENVSDDKRIKIVIGSGTIKEGINLQRYGTTLYNLYIDWNPTDVKQLEGRIWRQNNYYKSVRIVNPLLVDSSDIFIFQKLEEKTSRLNSIWSRNSGTSTLKLEEFNPKDLKYALIRDPYLVGRMKAEDNKALLLSEALSLQRNLESFRGVREDVRQINQYFDEAVSFIQQYRDIPLTDDKFADAQNISRTIKNFLSRQTDRDGKLMLPWNEKRNLPPEKMEKVSNLSPESRPWWFNYFALAVRDLKKLIDTVLTPNNISIDINDLTGFDSYTDDISRQILEINEKAEAMTDEKNIEMMAQVEMERREREKVEFKTIPESVADFSKMNYLLAEVKSNFNKLPTESEGCPPMKDGIRLIDPESLKRLQECIDKQPQTKDLYWTPGDGYTPERKKLHEKIIEDLFAGVKCVSRKSQPPICVLTGGAPGSGKSTWLRKNAKYLMKDQVFHLDADEIRAKLPEYKGWNASATHAETKDILNDVLEHIGDVSCRYDMIYDGTMNTAKKYFPLINKLKSLGYDIYIVFMNIPEAESKKRALARYQNPKKEIGRYVPMSVIDDFYEMLPPPINEPKAQYSLNQLKPLVTGYVEVESLTGKIIDKGGEPLPADRIYRGNLQLDFDGVGKDQKEPEEPKEPTKKSDGVSESQAIKNEIEALKLSIDYLDDAEAASAKESIKSLKLSLKYM